jgi:hypothetical protein
MQKSSEVLQRTRNTLPEPAPLQPTPQRGSTTNAGRLITPLLVGKLADTDKQQVTVGQQKKADLTFSLPPQLSLLIDQENIDWTGYQLGRSVKYTKAIPVLEKDSKEYNALVPAITAFESQLEPASGEQLMRILSELRLHKPMANLNENQAVTKLGAYLEDLEELPFCVVKEVCKIYRRSSKPEDRFFPEIAQILAIGGPILWEMKKKLERLKKLLDEANKPKQEELTAEQKEAQRERIAKMLEEHRKAMNAYE